MKLRVKLSVAEIGAACKGLRWGEHALRELDTGLEMSPVVVTLLGT